MKLQMDVLKFKPLWLFLFVITSVGGCHDSQDWFHWKRQYQREYETNDIELKHRQIWERNKAYMQARNGREDVTFKMELNQFADQEIQARPLLYNRGTAHAVSSVTEDEVKFVPSSWDWRKKGVVSPVENQGMTGDALTIVVTECVESYHAVQTGNLVRVSKAETRDCCTKQPFLSNKTFQCIHNIGGLCSEADYPQPHGTCMNNTCTAVAQIDGGNVVPSRQEDQLLIAVLKTPVLAGIDASHASFQMYRSGVYSEPACSSTHIDHVVQVVGYGSLDGTDYWICKNSWGVNWGMKGYILIARNKGNMCGIATMAMYPV